MTRSLTLDHTPNSLLAKEVGIYTLVLGANGSAVGDMCAVEECNEISHGGEREENTQTTLLVTLWYAFAIIGTIASK
eukprot:1199762-Amorphochlora_amoeboformis.AAC.1